MDGITGTTPSGATRLNFAQKAIATGMSLVLAFGLSPIGQVPAYADEGMTTQAAEVLGTQAAASGFGSAYYTVGASGADSNPKMTYNGPTGYDVYFHVKDSEAKEVIQNKPPASANPKDLGWYTGSGPYTPATDTTVVAGTTYSSKAATATYEIPEAVFSKASGVYTEKATFGYNDANLVSATFTAVDPAPEAGADVAGKYEYDNTAKTYTLKSTGATAASGKTYFTKSGDDETLTLPASTTNLYSVAATGVCTANDGTAMVPGGTYETATFNAVTTSNPYYNVKVYDADGKELKDGDAVACEQAENGDWHVVVSDTGKYRAVLTGTTATVDSGNIQSGNYAGETAEVNFEVGKLDLADAKFVAVDANGAALSSPDWLPYNAADQVVTARPAKGTGGAEGYVDYTFLSTNNEVVSSKATVNDISTYSVSVTPYGGADNENVTGTNKVTFQVTPNRYLVDASGSKTATSGTAAYAKVNGTPVTIAGNNAAATTGTIGSAGTTVQTADAAAVTAGKAQKVGDKYVEITDPAPVTINKVADPVEVEFNGLELDELSDYQITYDTFNATTGQWDTGVDVDDLPTAVNSYYRANIRVNNENKFTQVENLVVYLKVSNAENIEKVADKAAVADAYYLGGAPVKADAEGSSATFTKDGEDVSKLIGSAWTVIGNSYGVASGGAATTALIKDQVPVAAGDYTVKLTGDGTSFTPTSTGVDATFRVLPRAAKEGTAVGDLKITLNDQPYNNGDFVEMVKGTNFKVQMVIDSSGNTVDIDETYDAQLGNEVRNWKVTWKDSKGNKVIYPAAMGDYTGTFEFSGNLEGTATIVKDFKVSAGNIADFADGLSTDATGTLAYVVNPELTFTGVGQDVDKEDLTLVKKATETTASPARTKGLYYPVADTVADNCEYELSYAPRSEGAKVDADGKPLTVGTYTMTATFSGSYTGTLTGLVNVKALDLTNVVLSNTTGGAHDVTKTSGPALIQYEVSEGVYDAVYSAAYNNGEAIAPNVRIVAWDGKQFTDEATVIDPSVYDVAFTDNKTAGSTAKVTVTPKGDQGANVKYSFDEQEGAFAIADGSFAKIGASVKLSKSSAKLDQTAGAVVDDFTLQVPTTSVGALSYVAKDEKGYATGKYNVGGTLAPTKDGSCYYNAGAWYKYDGTLTGDARWTGTALTYTPASGSTPASGEVTTVVPVLGNAYSIRVLDPDGNDITSDITFSIANYADPTTVTVSDLPATTAGDYTIAVDAAASKPLYGGRVTAKFTVEALDISNLNDFSVGFITTQKNAETGATEYVTLPYGKEWTVGYDAVAAKSKEGIVLGVGNVGTKSVAGSVTAVPTQGVVVAPAGESVDPFAASTTAWLIEGKEADYTLAYEKNTEAGTAKVTIKGVGDYTGELVKEFTIERANLDYATVGIVYDDATVKLSNEDGKYHTPYTGSAIEPNYEVVIYKDVVKDASGNITSRTPVGYLDPAEYSAQWWNNTNVSYANNSPSITASACAILDFTKNYKGRVEEYKFQIDPVDLYNNPNVTVSDISDQVYTGSPIVPAIDVTLNGNKLVQGTDYVVTSDNDGSEGTHTAYVASVNRGNVTVSTPIAKTFNIKKAAEISYDLTGATVTLAKTSYTYNGRAQKPAVESVTLKDGKLLDKALYSVSYDAAKAAGKHTVTVKGAADNVTGTAKATYTIAKAKNTKFKVTAKKKVYTAKRTANKAFKASALYKVTGKAGKVTYKKANKAGKAKIVVAKNGKITVKKGLKAGTYKVKVKATSAANKNYKAASKNVTIKVKVTKK